MTETLLVAGSNSGYQLGVDHNEDVRTWQEALCRIDDGSQETVSFPPVGYSIVDISSGANHTLALLQCKMVGCEASKAGTSKEVWVAGTGTHGQLGPAHLAPGSKPVRVFTRFDLKSCLLSCVNLERSDLSEALLEPKRVVCGWNCSYVVIACNRTSDSDASGHDVLLSIGLHRENTFGELGCVGAPSSDTVDLGVHQVSFSSALAEAGLATNAPVAIVDVAAGLRHAVAALIVSADGADQRRLIVAGWGSARHGQVGRIPGSTKRPGRSKRPGCVAAAVVQEPQVIFDWSIRDPRNTSCKLRAGRDHTVVLMQDDSHDQQTGLYCIGSNRQGQLLDVSLLQKHATTFSEITQVSCNWNSTHLLIERKKGGSLILGCGSNSQGQLGGTMNEDQLVSADLTMILGISPTQASHASKSCCRTSTLQKLASGSEHSILLIESCSAATDTSADEIHSPPIVQRQVWGWGWNEHGNLAQGLHDEADRYRPTLLLSGTRSGAADQQTGCTPLDVWAGCGTSFVLVETTNKNFRPASG